MGLLLELEYLNIIKYLGIFLRELKPVEQAYPGG